VTVVENVTVCPGLTIDGVADTEFTVKLCAPADDPLHRSVRDDIITAKSPPMMRMTICLCQSNIITKSLVLLGSSIDITEISFGFSEHTAGCGVRWTAVDYTSMLTAADVDAGEDPYFRGLAAPGEELERVL